MTQTPPAADPQPEIRMAHGLLQRLRQDLFTDVFAYRPLPPLPEARIPDWLQHLPNWLRRGVRWAPHGVVCAMAAMVLLGGLAKATGNTGIAPLVDLTLAAMLSVPLALVLLRPLGAFWISLAGAGLALLADSANGPWAGVSLPTHLLVMMLVVLRTRPLLAAEMWLLSLGVAATVAVVFPGTGAATAVPVMAFFYAVLLAAAAAVRAWRSERAHVVETEKVTAQERAHRTLLEERSAIARELHDVLAHHISVVAIQAEAAPYRVQDVPEELATSFSTIRENAVAALAELRRILGVMRSQDPEVFGDSPEDPQPTLADIGALLDRVREAGLEVETVVTGAAKPLPAGVELSAYRLLQEALSNVLRHSPGASARVEVSYVLGGLGLRVVNGTPSRLAKPSPGEGHGVLGMRERVQVLGGEMTAEPTDDGGFEVAAFIPATSPTSTTQGTSQDTSREDAA